ncbi:uncharacterized protein EI97DRAFT_71999 [Westerdykella ornata]|uniref:Uncharacterized protein n=1 Tax=Westerdykella ornata TaxID=318751 RepID=A0A6A6JGA8_WESOR|nr:uncharacterized protein EI97DRAFT_71999 [Westerdykella ornata]KAF2275305.1 hypothetical protein EI97DRAFT_71999 [Westerdykella ornata]
MYKSELPSPSIGPTVSRLHLSHVRDAGRSAADCHAGLEIVDYVADESDEEEEDEDDEKDDDVALHLICCRSGDGVVVEVIGTVETGRWFGVIR